MRKWKKDSIDELLGLLQKAQERIQIIVKQKEEDLILDLLQQCQQAAIQIGTIIEESEGDGFVTVGLLEEYCESVFCVHENIQYALPGTDVLVENMGELLNKIMESVSEDIRVSKEVVFLPYKASMWDSLESVWKAADEDPECDAYVIPIPYFDKNPDGTAKELHYEGELFPKYVTITNYNDYDIKARCPDMIFIHNPYDEANYVTSVHPLFYSKNLKQYTDCLVYIPYFVLGDLNLGDKAAVKGIEHFVMLPGVIHAHKVVVQSETMRQIYIDVMTEHTEDELRGYWENKITGLGSPKYDKLYQTQKTSVSIPEEWIEIIQKPNGERKKIVFYNTSVTALLNLRNGMLDKMRSVFKVFEEEKDEIVLLWRPHPLIKATISSMCPHLWKDYQEMVENYIKEAWGIYDDTPDMNRAIAMCDAYYGDGSSLTELCHKVGKPVILQDTEMIECREFYIQNDYMYREDGQLWFVGRRDNILYRMDENTRIVEYICTIPSDMANAYRMTPRCIKHKSEIWCIPDRGKSIYIYNLVSGEFSKIEIEGSNSCRLKIYGLWKAEESLWLVSNGLNSIIEVDLTCKEVKQHYSVFDGITDDLGICESIKIENKIYAVSEISNRIYEFDTALKTGKLYELPVDDEFATISYDGNYFWLSGHCKKIYIWDSENDAITEVDSLPINIISEDDDKSAEFGKYKEAIFYTSKKVNDEIVFLPRNAKGALCKQILCINKDTLAMRAIKLTENMEKREGVFSCEYCMDENKVSIYSVLRNACIEMDVVQGRYVLKSMQIDEVNKKKIVEAAKEAKRCIQDGMDLLFEYLLNVEETAIVDEVQDVGTRIYQSMDERKTI